MPAVEKILEQKGRDVIRIDGDSTVLEAVQAMVDANVGAILVTAATMSTTSRGSSRSATTCGGSPSRGSSSVRPPSAT